MQASQIEKNISKNYSPLRLTNKTASKNNLDDFITSRLCEFDGENPLYCKPSSLDDWYSSWDFGEFDANIYNHGLHQYPARFVPQLARKLLRTFADENSAVLDIFSGSGTTLLECKYLGIKKAIGIELNPFANFMAKTKLENLEVEDAEKAFDFAKQIFFDGGEKFKLANFKNIDFWYSKKTIADLSKLLDAITKIKNENARNFLLLAFCETTRKTSYLDAGGFKMYRSRSKIKTVFEPDVFKEFEKVFSRNIKLLKANNDIIPQKSTSQILLQGDSRFVRPEIEAESVDFILTSPPYGDSKTTVAYGQYSRLPWQWLSQNDDIIQLDNNLLGGKTKNANAVIVNFSPTLKTQLAEIENADSSKRSADVISFYSDLHETLKSASHYLKREHYFVLVTGNRTVKKVYLRTDLIISELSATLGFSTEKICSRNIINKRMASKNSPTNEKGKTASTMMTENIIILKKN